MTYTRQNENGGAASSIIPVSSPLVTNGELDGSQFVQKEEYKYQEGTLYQADNTGWTADFSVVNGVTFVPDYNDEEVFEHVYTVPAGDVSSDTYSWRKPFTVNFTETYQSDPGPPPVYSNRAASRNIAVSFRTRLDGVRLTFPTWASTHEYYYADTYSNTVIVDAGSGIDVGDTLNGNTVTQIFKGTLYDHVTFTGSNGFSVGAYGSVNVLCGLGIKNKFGVMGQFFTEFNTLRIVPDFQAKLKDEYSKLIEDIQVLTISEPEVNDLYQSCYTEIGAQKLESVINDIYEPARRLNSSLSFKTFENTYVTDGSVSNYQKVVATGVLGQNTITTTEPVTTSVTFRGNNCLTIGELDNAVVTAINGNTITLDRNLTKTFTERTITITKSYVLNRFLDLPPSCERLKFYLSDYQPLNGNLDFYQNRKNYPSVFSSFSDDVGLFTVDYDWTLVDSKSPSLQDVDSTLTNDPDLGSLWDYPSTDQNGQFYIEGSSNEQYKINVNITTDGNGFLSTATLTGTYTSTSITQLFGDNPYDTATYDFGDATGTEEFYDYKRDHIITFAFDVGNVGENISKFATTSAFGEGIYANITQDLSKTDTVINVNSTVGFDDDGYLLIPKYTLSSEEVRYYDLSDWEIVRYDSKTSTSFIVAERGAMNTTAYDFPLYGLEDPELDKPIVLKYEGYGAIDV